MWKIIVTAAICIAVTSALPAKQVKQYASAVPRVPVPAGSTGPVRPDGRIIDGTDAEEGQFPYQIYMEISGNFQCGGSILDETWILTAAHCVNGYAVDTITVTAGAYIISQPSGDEQVREAANTIPHEAFGAFTLKNDIALIELSSPLDLEGPNVAPIPLPTAGPAIGEEVIISGWGRTSDGGALADTLQFTTLTVADPSVCDSVYSNLDSENLICYATTDGPSACNGDSGGPMVPLDQSVVYGATSFGSSAGCEAGYPGAYTNVAMFLDWINSHMS